MLLLLSIVLYTHEHEHCLAHHVVCVIVVVCVHSCVPLAPTPGPLCLCQCVCVVVSVSYCGVFERAKKINRGWYFGKKIFLNRTFVLSWTKLPLNQFLNLNHGKNIFSPQNENLPKKIRERFFIRSVEFFCRPRTSLAYLFLYSAARIVFSINAHLVSNPTPPGTGVTILLSVLIQSPTNLPSLKLMPTSTTGT